MPGKRVRFSKTKSVYSPPTSALSFTSMSPASSAALMTPPNTHTGLPGPSPYTIDIFASKSSCKDYHHHYPAPAPPPPIQPRAHLLLEYHSSPSIDYNLVEHPSTMTSRHRGLSTRVLGEPAVSPPLRSLTISTPHLPWKINVYASKVPFVTVMDVLETVYNSLRKNIAAADFDSLPSSSAKRLATRAYESRYRMLQSTRAYEAEKHNGMKQVDFLMGMTTFMGLTPSSSGSSWILQFA